MRTLMVLAVIAVAACSPAAGPSPSEPVHASVAAPATSAPPADEARCTANGGEWRPVCRMQQPACVTKFADAGKICSDGDDCAGDCLAKSDAGFVQGGMPVTGLCAVNDDPCGCKQTVEDGKATTTICID